MSVIFVQRTLEVGIGGDYEEVGQDDGHAQYRYEHRLGEGLHLGIIL